MACIPSFSLLTSETSKKIPTFTFSEASYRIQPIIARMRKHNVMINCFQGPVARRLVSANRLLRGIKTYRFPWYLMLVSANHALSNPGQVHKELLLQIPNNVAVMPPASLINKFLHTVNSLVTIPLANISFLA